MFAEDEVDENSAASAPSSTLKKRGRPSLSASATPAKSASSRTPRSAKSATAPKSASRSAGKCKAAETELEEEEGEEGEGEEDVENTPAPKRGRPARSAGTSVSARLAAKAAKKPARGRPRSTAVSTTADMESLVHNANVKQTGRREARRASQKGCHQRGGSGGRIRGRDHRPVGHRRRHHGTYVPGQVEELPRQ